jgi:TPR repeat protein
MYAQLPLIALQFAWLYAFDALLAWSRGRPWRLGSGPTPIVLSTNLFIWFHDEHFAWQFVMVTAGLLGKEFVKWQKDGRRTHIFNPSGFGLACAATVLIATDTTDLTWARPLATTIEVPGVFVFLFCLGMVVQHFFQVTLMTFAAALAMVATNVVYTEVTGVYLFGSSNLPAAAFLGLHLLMTDPSTSPRSYVGRTLFGLGYGFGYVVAYQVLGWLGAPELYAKLYPVPILNCCVQWLDRLAGRGLPGRVEAWWRGRGSPRVVNAVHMAGWAAVFAVLLGIGYVQAPHPGDSIPFWKRAVAEGRHDAQRKLALVAGSQAIAGQNGDAYNELGILSLLGEVDAADAMTRHKSAGNWFYEGARRGSLAAMENQVAHFLYHGVRRSDAALDLALRRLEQEATAGARVRALQLLGLAHETGGAKPLDLKRALELYRRCGDDRAARFGIVRIGLGANAIVDLSPHTAAVQAAAAGDDAEACYYWGWMHQLGRGVPRDTAAARRWLQRAAELGFVPAQDLLREVGARELPQFATPRRKFLVQPAWTSAYVSAS